MTPAYVGQSIDMLGAAARVTGRIDFALNTELPGMLHAKLLRSELPHARVRDLDVSKAAAMPGIVAVLTAADLGQPGGPQGYYGPLLQDQPVLARDKVRFAGDPVAAVAAESEEAAERALVAIEVEYEPLPVVGSISEALAAGAPTVHDAPAAAAPGYADVVLLGREGNICSKFQLRRGDVEQGFAEADVVVEGVYSSPPIQHVPMEPHVALAAFEGDRLTVITSTQSPYAVRDSLAALFGLPMGAVRVIVPPLGGGFGAKTYTKFEPVTAALAWKAGRPVKLVLSREEEFVSLTKHGVRVHMRTGAKHDGMIVAREITAHWNAGAYADMSPRVVKNGGYSCVGPYVIPHVKLDSYAVYTNLPPAGPFRGYGVAQAAWAHEQQMDELADSLDLDPVELRHRNLLTEGAPFATGEEMHEAHWGELLRRSADAIGWADGRRHELGDNRVRGKGIAVVLKSTITPSTSNASVRLDSDGSLQVMTSAVEMGQGAQTVLAQLAADELGVPPSFVNVTHPDTQFTPYDQTTSSSRTTTAVGRAVMRATEKVRSRLLELASDLMEVTPEDLVIEEGRVHVKGDPGGGMDIRALLTVARVGSLGAEGEVRTSGGLDPQTGQGVASDHWHQGAAGVEVEVDLETGKVYIRDVHAIVFAGRVVNPKLARMQMHGNVLFAIGAALYEELVFEEGVLTNPNLSDYTIATLGDMPERMEVEFLEDAGGSLIHGIGETALPPVLAATGNAVANALESRIRTLPITPERVLHARRGQ